MRSGMIRPLTARRGPGSATSEPAPPAAPDWDDLIRLQLTRNRLERLSSLLQLGVDAPTQHLEHGVARDVVQREQPFRVRDPR